MLSFGIALKNCELTLNGCDIWRKAISGGVVFHDSTQLVSHNQKQNDQPKNYLFMKITSIILKRQSKKNRVKSVILTSTRSRFLFSRYHYYRVTRFFEPVWGKNESAPQRDSFCALQNLYSKFLGSMISKFFLFSEKQSGL